ncbi:MAG: putative short-chain dehydrogenase [Myxococcaceae bacterium]|nr:putative short-chain dehydrogenase [Myxococcaceae bacterium]
MHIVITGASSGIGAALARELATLPNARLTLVARRRPLLESVARELAVPTLVIERDLAATDATATDWLAEAERAHGPVDVLINNAGVQVIGRTSSIDVARGEASLQVNLLTPLRLTRAVLPGMLERRAGTVVDIASMAALAPTPGMTYYNASKAGLAAASEALRGELRGTGVEVVTVYPGIVATDMAEGALHAYGSNLALRMQPTGTTAGLARMVRTAIVRKRPRVIYPRAYFFMRWVTPIVRWFLDNFSPALKEA